MKFSDFAPAANPVFYRTYSRKINNKRESFLECAIRITKGLVILGKLTKEEENLIFLNLSKQYCFPSGRWLWVGGTSWIDNPNNFPGAYNCSSTNVDSWESFALIMDLAMQGCGTGAVLEEKYIKSLPKIDTKINVKITSLPRKNPKSLIERLEETVVSLSDNSIFLFVGDSRSGWTKAYLELFKIASSGQKEVNLFVNLSNVRPKGEILKGFGGTANPIKLPDLFIKCSEILNEAVGRNLNSVECSLLINESALVVVAGNIRRSANIQQSDSYDHNFAIAKDNLWQQDEHGNWSIDPKKDSLRMANLTRVFHTKPTLKDCIDSVRKQYYSGEGAIQYANEAIVRANADILLNESDKQEFRQCLENKASLDYFFYSRYPDMDKKEIEHRCRRYGLNPCGEILLNNNFCNLSEVHLNNINPIDFDEQESAFKSAALCVVSLLHHHFVEERYQYSREVDPIVGVSFTGLFDFFVKAFGIEWLEWWNAGRPDQYRLEVKTLNGITVENAAKHFKELEAFYLNKWREMVFRHVWEYCDRHGLRRPNRCTTVQPAGCLDRTALRIFDQGLLYADEIVKAGSGEIKGLDLSVRNGIAANTAIANQPLNLVRVTLESGRILRMTANHRISIANQWIRADQLKIGMDIDYSLGEYKQIKDEALLSLDPVQYTRKGRSEILGHGRGVLTIDIKTPTTLNPELGYFLGCLFGDGAISESKNRVRFAFNEKEIDLVERLQSIAQNQFGITGSVAHDPRNGGTRGELTFASGQLFDWLNLNQLQKEKSKDLDRIPLAIRKSSRETILAFFCGLIDTDGCVREKGSLSIDSSSEAFIRNLQQIGEAIGLCFSIFHNTKGKNFQGQRNMWGVSLSRMLSEPESLDYLNTHSRKCQLRPLPKPKRQFAFHPYRIIDIEFETIPDYSYDFAVSGINDDDSWYWQGALKSHNTKSLLTNASPGWHPPKSQRFIRRITFAKNDPVALACLDYGYNVIPAQSDRDEHGNLLNDPFDPRCTEWLVEIPTEVPWANLEGADQIDISKFSALAQFDFYMQVQQHYTTHNCFSRDTTFLTNEGIKSFEEYEGGDTVIVLNKLGKWAEATVVKTKELRQMIEIVIKEGKSGKEKRIVTTECHRFPVKRISAGDCLTKIVRAKDLKIGHRFVVNATDFDFIDLDITSIQHGIVYGDGSVYKDSKGRAKGCQVYLCNAKRELVTYFENKGRIKEQNDINQTRIYGLPSHWKKLPENPSQEYLAGFIAGLLATDGNIHRSTISISSSKQELVDFLYAQSPKIGLKICGHKWYASNSYKENGGAFSITFSKSTFSEKLVLRSNHQDHFNSYQSQPCQWKVTEINYLEKKQQGWCVMEAETNHFTLSDNILTMNTSATIEFTEQEIEPLGTRIYEAINNDEGYISAALLARFEANQTFPRLPFEPISKSVYEELQQGVLSRRKSSDFLALLSQYDQTESDVSQSGPAACDSDKCLMP